MEMTAAREKRASLLHPNTRLGAVHLTVSDLGRSLDFYQRALGLQVHPREGDTAYLGTGREDLLALTEEPAAIHVGNHAGLYHLALLVPSRRELAQSLRRFSETGTRLQGFADHWVSEAIYLADPDGNGIEIYRDQPRSRWPYGPAGELRMGTSRLDVEDLLSELNGEAGPWDGMDGATVMGHVHLTVGDLAEAVAFYGDVVGFDMVLTDGRTVAFLSDGGYHHHIGLNTWSGAGAPPTPPNAVGLRHFTVQLNDGQQRAALIGRLEDTGASFEERDDGLFARDPSQNGVLFTPINRQER
jgi:catechol 2,3-dioxygenase